ncbi:hypothetical protein [Prescottella equi]|uniref:hypothetical protein n=1 Tax=Rhodococcus hoagii TaxID=43767 RepID=UPI00301BC99D
MTAAPPDPLLIVDAHGSPIATTDVQAHAAAVAELVTAAVGGRDRGQAGQAVGEIQARLGVVFPLVAMEALVFLGHDVITTMSEQLRRCGVTPEETATEVDRRRAWEAVKSNQGGE